jgi:hypothetical protein
VTWVGTVRLPQGETLTGEDQESLARALSKLDCVPVFLDATLHEKFYKNFCKVRGLIIGSLAFATKVIVRSLGHERVEEHLEGTDGCRDSGT